MKPKGKPIGKPTGKPKGKSKGKPKVLERIVSESVLQEGSVVSRHHCQPGREFPLYTLEEVKKANNKTRKSKSPNKRNSHKVRSI